MQNKRDLSDFFHAPENFDQTDFDIVCYLETNGRTSIKDLADKLNISPSNVSNRLTKLQNNKYLLGYFPLFVHNKLGFSNELIALIQIDPQRPLQEVSEEIAKINGVKSLYRLIGEYDLVLQICCIGNKELDDILSEINKVRGIKHISKSLVQQIVKENFQILSECEKEELK